ncbi:nuclear transport factor 2 family protein [Luteibacter pinisoli]|uniref:Nuclear transport factor 2 family protein n=1 Tax=Luteibacter pinisoli TaxID=2589080 RepID=A0A4Y5Z3L4_9GAMM|nr:nuclear transport factor 2 family protein [Luteibacter pinisoli]QDE39003.1 nuclear transport factor 2 family protein [Luteibacter pinisoli]
MHSLIRIVVVSMALLPCFAMADSAEQEVTRLEDAWRTARIHGDTAFLERVYARDLEIGTMDGNAVPRDQDIALFASGDIKPKFIDHGPLRIQVSGDTAVVSGVDHLGGTYKGHYGEMSIRFTNVWLRHAGQWQLIASQNTRVQEKPH